MSNSVRWFIAIALTLLGIAVAAFAFFSGAFSTVACPKVPPDWVYYVLVLAALVTLAAAVTPAVMLVRKAKGVQVAVALVIGILLSCSGYGAYLYLLGQSC